MADTGARPFGPPTSSQKPAERRGRASDARGCSVVLRCIQIRVLQSVQTATSGRIDVDHGPNARKLQRGSLDLRQGVLLSPGLRRRHVLELRGQSIHELGHGARKKILASSDHSRLHSTALPCSLVFGSQRHLVVDGRPHELQQEVVRARHAF